MGLRTAVPTRLSGAASRGHAAYERLVLSDNPILFAPVTDPTTVVANRVSASLLAIPATGTFSGTYTNGAESLIPGLGANPSLGGGYVDFGNIGFSPSGTTGLMTFEMVVRPTAVNLGAQMLLTVNFEWQVRIESDGSLLFDVNSLGTNAVMDAQTSASFMAAGVRHHIVGTYNRPSPRIELWVDGVSVASSTSVAASGVTNGSGALQIGHREDGGGSAFGGPIGWVSIYDHVLSDAAIAAHAKAAAAGGRWR